uniref:Contactin associated protein like 3 n=1 Tax=Ornithorhynchus anatinus TaxID=9258 RepID=A0A6I8NKZ9_ORNAN
MGRETGGYLMALYSFSKAECEEQLVSGLPPASFRSSSQLSASHGPAFAKLNRREGAGGWTPLVSDRGQWLQVDLGRRTEIRRVATQGSYGSPHWVTEFSLLSSDGGTNWKEHRRQEGGPGFPGNSNADSVSQQVLSPPLRARLVRLVPLAWHRQIGLRLGLFGCAFRSDVATVDGTGRLVYSPAGVRPGPCPPTVSLHFKTLQAHGVLLSWTGPHGTPLTLGLVRGHLLLLLLLRAGEASRTVRLGSLLDDGHWHRVVLEHCQGGGNLTVDGHSQAFALPRLTLGGPAGSSPPPPAPPGNFRGCLENVYHNGVSVLDLARRGDPQVPGPVGGRGRWRRPDGSRLGRDGSPGVPPAGGAWADGQWHAVALRARGRTLGLHVDQEALGAQHRAPPEQLRAGRLYRFGGCSLGSECKIPFRGFQGCVRDVGLGDGPVDLLGGQQVAPGNRSGVRLDLCGMTDRCFPNLCEHRGICTQTWTDFQCDCSGTGYGGAVCHHALFEPSCEAYKHEGRGSGFYHIDADGSGPLDPLLVFCDMSDSAWTLVHPKGPERPRPGSALTSITYEASAEQLRAVVEQADHCEQAVFFRSALRPGTRSGAPSPEAPGPVRAGVHHSAPTGLVRRREREAGLVSGRDDLPVLSIVLADSQPDAGDRADFSVGPLRCRGDRSFWNSASFSTEPSHLHFPTMAGELSLDVSFFFKSRAGSGVFLENLGMRDFIRLELQSPSSVSLVLDAGTGPTQVTVWTPAPLDDGRWHRVRAERTVLDARLQVDALPPAVRPAPAPGPARLQLSSKLFVGGSASRQRGLGGCVRWLRVNGRPLDVERRAAVTPGVEPGCAKHCATYAALCANGGRCTEARRGVACDCGPSPFAGPFCRHEISAVFGAGGSLTYDLGEPAGGGNGSAAPRDRAALGFRTLRTPASLLHLRSDRSGYLAVRLSSDGSLQIGYRPDAHRAPDVFTAASPPLADGRLHRLALSREGAVDDRKREEFALSSGTGFSAFRQLILGSLGGKSGTPGKRPVQRPARRRGSVRAVLVVIAFGVTLGYLFSASRACAGESAGPGSESLVRYVTSGRSSPSSGPRFPHRHSEGGDREPDDPVSPPGARHSAWPIVSAPQIIITMVISASVERLLRAKHCSKRRGGETDATVRIVVTGG